MDKRFATALTIGAAIAAILLPIALSIYLARNQGLEAEAAKALGYAHDVLNRSEMTADQVDRAIKKLVSVTGQDPCSESHLAVMREMALTSSYVQAFGFVSDGKMICSSLGQNNGPLALGPVDYVSHRGVRMRFNVSFPFVLGKKFIVLEKNGYAAILNKNLSIDATTQEKDASLAAFNLGSRTLVSSRGFLKPEWIDTLDKGGTATLQDGEYTVAIVKSRRYEIGAIAALPITYVDQRTHAFALLLVPIGALGGLGIAAAILYLARQQRTLPAIIKGALKRKEFFLLYQPIVDLQNACWVGAEVLIRWRRPNGDLLQPDIFIPAAENSGLIQQITAYIMEHVAQDAHEIFKRHPNFHIAINLSAADLVSHQTVEMLQTLRRQTEASPGNLLVEATERGFLNAGHVRETLREIRKGGVQIAIDDFGTGYSSLSYLETFELDYLKIDKSFVDTLAREAATSQVVPHIIEMAKSLKLQMIAEGVETEIQAQFLRERGVQFAQGWLFAKPMSFRELMAGMSHSL